MTVLEPTRLEINLPVVLRLAEKTDLPKLEWYGAYKHYRNVFRRAYREQLKGRRLMLVADCSDFPIGHVFIQLNSTNGRIADGQHRAYLYSFRVMEMFRRRGIGSALLNEAEQMLLDRGYHTATIAVAKTNEDALRLYERRGYQRFGQDPGRWSYVDHRGRTRQVEEACWVLEKTLSSV